ncbi:MAG: hypothetical protein WBW36_08515, partial [Candidatus Sulfotelmatobacter sp.]
MDVRSATGTSSTVEERRFSAAQDVNMIWGFSPRKLFTTQASPRTISRSGTPNFPPPPPRDAESG